MTYSDLGSFQIEGLKVTGTANKVTAQNWDSAGNKEGYFLGLHFDNCKKFATAKNPGGKAPDGTGDVLFLIGEDSITLKWIDVTDTKDKTDRYIVDITAAN